MASFCLLGHRKRSLVSFFRFLKLLLKIGDLLLEPRYIFCRRTFHLFAGFIHRFLQEFLLFFCFSEGLFVISSRLLLFPHSGLNFALLLFFPLLEFSRCACPFHFIESSFQIAWINSGISKGFSIVIHESIGILNLLLKGSQIITLYLRKNGIYFSVKGIHNETKSGFAPICLFVIAVRSVSVRNHLPHSLASSLELLACFLEAIFSCQFIQP